MKMLRDTIIAFMITITVGLVVFATNMPNQKEIVLSEAQGLCRTFLTQCETQVIESDKPFAQTVAGRYIQISSKMGEILTLDEYRSVVYHEVGHVVLRHSQRQANWLISSANSGTFSKEAWIEMRHTHEYEADRFTSYTLLVINKTNKLDSALMKVVPSSLWNITTETHPSINNRIKRINDVKNRGLKQLRS